MLCTSQWRGGKEKGKERAHNTRWPKDLEKCGNILLSVAERYFVVTAFNTSGRILINELARTQKISFPVWVARDLAEEYFMAELGLPVRVLHEGAPPALEMKAMSR